MSAHITGAGDGSFPDFECPEEVGVRIKIECVEDWDDILGKAIPFFDKDEATFKTKFDLAARISK